MKKARAPQKLNVIPFSVNLKAHIVDDFRLMEKNTKKSVDELVEKALLMFIATHNDYLGRNKVWTFWEFKSLFFFFQMFFYNDMGSTKIRSPHINKIGQKCFPSLIAQSIQGRIPPAGEWEEFFVK